MNAGKSCIYIGLQLATHNILRRPESCLDHDTLLRHLSPVSTTRVHGPSSRVVETGRTRVHGPCRTGSFLTPELTARVDGCQKMHPS